MRGPSSSTGLPLGCCQPCASEGNDAASGRPHFILQQDAMQRQVASNRLRKPFLDTRRSASAPALRQHALLPVVANYDATPLWPYVLEHGRGIMSLSTFQPGLYYFELPGLGYLAYALMANGPDFLNILSPVVLGDPIAAPQHTGTIAAAFLARHPDAMFMQISGEFAEVLHRQCGLRINNIGGETRLDLATYSFSGYSKRGLRSAIAGAVKEGVSVEEVMHPAAPAPLGAKLAAAGRDSIERSSSGSSDSNDSSTIMAGAAAKPSPVAAPPAPARGLPAAGWEALAAEMRNVDAAWVAAKGRNAARVWFLNRLPVLAPEPGVRKLVARDSAGGLLAFIFFDAVYEAGQVVGYYANVTRMRPDAHPGVLNLLVKEFLDRLRAENQLAAPARKLSMKKSQREKLAAAAAGAAAAQEQADATIAAASQARPSGSGVRFVSLGLSPLFQIDDSRFPHSKRLHRALQLFYKTGSAFYPFKSLAAAKAKYGGGLHNGRYDDPAVSYLPSYLAHSHKATANVALFDLGKLIGFWQHPLSAAGIFAGHKLGAAASMLSAKARRSKSAPAAAAAAPGEPDKADRQQAQKLPPPPQPKQAAAINQASSKAKPGVATAAHKAHPGDRRQQLAATIKPPSLLQLQADARVPAGISSSSSSLIPAAASPISCISLSSSQSSSPSSSSPSSTGGRLSSSSIISGSSGSAGAGDAGSSSSVGSIGSNLRASRLQRQSGESFYSSCSS